MIVLLGAFDGFHRGHRLLLEKGRELAEKSGDPRNWCVVTFSPHPGNILHGTEIPVLFTEDERDLLALSMKIPRTIKIPFTRSLAEYSPEQFLDFLQGLLPVSGIVVGGDFRFGSGRTGDTAFLRRYSAEKGWAFAEVEPFTIDGVKVGSRNIRNAVAHGDTETARNLLGYPFFFSGEVIVGDRRGQKLGFPTANVLYPAGKVIPRRGVYAASVFAEEQWYAGALNIGYNPTFLKDNPLRTETYILDFQGDLYGKWIVVFLEEYLREEKKFPSAAELIETMNDDIDRTRRIVAERTGQSQQLFHEIKSTLLSNKNT